MIDSIIKELNSEIERLTRVRDLLISESRSRKRPFRHRRPMSPATKAKIAAAAKARWAARRRKKTA